jgi:hypothetical protein
VETTNAAQVKYINTASRGKRMIPKHGLNIFAYGTMTMTLLIITMVVQLYLAPLFIHFGDDSDVWLKCVKADWQSSRGVENNCDDKYPSSRPPVSIMSLRYFCMSAIPLVVGSVFGFKFLLAAITKILIQVTGHKSTKVSSKPPGNDSYNNASHAE